MESYKITADTAKERLIIGNEKYVKSKKNRVKFLD